MSEWKSIETAPKDGTPVLLWHKFLVMPAACFWDADEGMWSSTLGRSVWSEGGDDGPSHWHEIPEPPQ